MNGELQNVKMIRRPSQGQGEMIDEDNHNHNIAKFSEYWPATQISESATIWLPSDPRLL